MPRTLSTDALSSVEAARAQLKRAGLNPTDVEDDELILRVNAFSKRIARYLEREFLPKVPALDASAPVTRTFAYEGNGYLSLAPYDLRSLGGTGFGGTGTIVEGVDLPAASQTTLTPQSSTVESDYRLNPRGRSLEGTYHWLVLPRLAFTSWERDRLREVSVTGYWGVGSVPEDVELACLIAVAASFRNPEGFGTRTLGDFSFSEVPEEPSISGYSIPPKARDLLDDYRRVAVP